MVLEQFVPNWFLKHVSYYGGNKSFKCFGLHSRGME